MPDQPANQTQPEHSAPALTAREIEQIQEIIIRAHYLSLELRDICAVSGIGSRHMSLAASHMLKAWAVAFSNELEIVRQPGHSP